MPADPRIYFDPEPDPLETTVRLVCGAVFGLVPAAAIAWTYGPFTAIGSIALFGTSAALCALLALRYGDDFWHTAIRWGCRLL